MPEEPVNLPINQPLTVELQIDAPASRAAEAARHLRMAREAMPILDISIAELIEAGRER